MPSAAFASATFHPFDSLPPPRPVSTSSSSSTTRDDASQPERSLDICAATFYDQASDIHSQLDALKDHFDTVRALSERLYALHPNALETPTLALDLRDALLYAAGEIKGVDSDLFELWKEEERVRLAAEGKKYRLQNVSAVGDQEGELEERREEVDGLVKRFGRRAREIKREARGERKDRKEDGEKKEPEKLPDYLEDGVYEWPHLLTKDTVHASRWVVSNPFTILSRLTDNLKALKIPHLLASRRTPLTFTPPPSAPPLYPVSSASALVQPYKRGLLHTRSSSRVQPIDPNPTPLGHSSSKPMADWKQEILDEKRSGGKPTWSKRFFDEVAMDGAEGYREIKVSTGRGHRERWIIFVTLAVFPLLLIAQLISTWLPSSASSSNTSSSSSGSLSMRSIAPTLIGDEDPSSARPTALSNAGEEREANLRERRRRSLEMDGEVV
ncbi:hypothetical protein JCM11641_005453 [Rhodosporidiobolus odoratus]